MGEGSERSGRIPPLLSSVARTVGYGIVGVLITAGIAVVSLLALQPIQEIIYDWFYLLIGPSEATSTAIFTHFIIAAVLGLSTTILVADFLSTRLRNRRVLGKVFVAFLSVIVLFLVIAVLGVAAFLTAILVMGVVLIGIPIVLRLYYHLQAGVVAAFIGGVPVVVFLLLLAGFGVGWGWGYVMTVSELPANESVEGPVGSFEEVPEVKANLFDTNRCAPYMDELRRCRLQLRDYQFEQRAVRFMARYGVQCPFQGTGDTADAMVATVNDTRYRVTCHAHGD